MTFAAGLRALGGIVVLLVVALMATTTRAHESRPAYLQITQTAPSQYELVWRTPVLGSMPLPVVLRLPEGVSDVRNPLIHELSDSRLERRWIETGPDGLAGERINFPGLELTITEAIVQANFLDGRTWMSVARAGKPWVELAADSGSLQVFREFVRQGVEHILFGVDHLLFVFGLLLLVPSLWMLVKTISAFTLAHSITLTVATLGFVDPPAASVSGSCAPNGEKQALRSAIRGSPRSCSVCCTGSALQARCRKLSCRLRMFRWRSWPSILAWN